MDIVKRPDKRAERSRRTREKVIEAARELFVAQWPDGPDPRYTVQYAAAQAWPASPTSVPTSPPRWQPTCCSGCSAHSRT